jgi:hypothetical protein
MWASEGQITAVQHQVGSNLLQVSEDGLEGGKVAVDIRNDRDSHKPKRYRSCPVLSLKT